MLIVIATLAGILTVPLFGGRLDRLADTRLRRSWTLVAALLGQVLVISVLRDLPGPLARASHLATYALAAVFLWSNRRVAGLWLVAAGAAANAFVISINGGVMPASALALRRAGISPAAGQFENSAHLAHAHLAFLGDTFAMPAGWPFANVFSVGDVLIVVGAVVTLHILCGSRLPRRRRPIFRRAVARPR
jgi:hypothetical protein